MELAELLNAIVKSYGLIGIFMLTPVVACVFLWRDNVRLNKEIKQLVEKHSESIDEVGKRVAAAHEKRVEDSQKLNTELVKLVAEHSASAKETTLALDRVGDMVSMLNAQFNGVVSSSTRRLGGGG